MVKALLIALGCFMVLALSAQNKTGQEFFEKIEEKEEGKGILDISQSQEIKNMVGIHIDSNKRNNGISGFRIQLYLGSNNNAKKEASEIKGKVLDLFPEEKIYIMYEAPFWRVQVGDFRSKNESLKLYRKLRKEFPSCYPVPVDDISLSSLK